MILIAQGIVIIFGIFIIASGFLMLFMPEKSREILRKAGSTNLINYGEITIRMIPAIALIVCSNISKFPLLFKLLGWFMLLTSLVLYFVPRRIHHAYSLKSADIIRPLFFQLISPLAFFFGATLIYCLIC